jgi:hypothetical protein
MRKNSFDLIIHYYDTRIGPLYLKDDAEAKEDEYLFLVFFCFLDKLPVEWQGFPVV